ncbi:MAG: translational GTPase TypA [bacterium]|nr:translational GTPase TypA [bacterium]
MADIRNIAIIAHVDHGKTTLVDGMLKQTHTFRANEAEMSQTTILDSNELERERGITILSKNTAVNYNGVKINIIDTPGHADFGGEVERVLSMADGALLVVDAAEGPLPQTKFVLQKALEAKLKIILVINKIDKRDARPAEVLHACEELFLRLATHSEHLSFPVIYAVGREGRAGLDPDQLAPDLAPLFELIVTEVPQAVKELDQPMQLQISTLDYDAHLGKLGIGRISRGVLKLGQSVALIDPTKTIGNFRIEKLFTSEGLHRVSVSEASSGDIVAIAGIADLTIGQTLTDPGQLQALPQIEVSQPTMQITIGPNTSPFAGRDGKFVTSRQISARLLKEAETNLGLKVADIGGGSFVVSGRGELHLAVLLENMRREGYELQVSQPQVIIQNNQEPYEEVTIDVADEYVGVVTTEMGQRRANMVDMHADGRGTTRMVFEISQRNLMGARNNLLTQSKGTVLFNTAPLGYRPVTSTAERLRNGVLLANDSGKSAAYSLENAQTRGQLFIDPAEDIYEGQIIGLNSRDSDMEINVCKDKHLTNTRAANKDMRITLTPPIKMSLEQALDFIESDELIELTPHNLRLRKKSLTKLDRVRSSRSKN